MFAWMYGGVAGHTPNPAWPWIVLGAYGPICLLMMVVAAVERDRPRRERVRGFVGGLACLALAAAPAVGRLLGLVF